MEQRVLKAVENCDTTMKQGSNEPDGSTTQHAPRSASSAIIFGKKSSCTKHGEACAKAQFVSMETKKILAVSDTMGVFAITPKGTEEALAAA
jgi:hypothetical protein